MYILNLLRTYTYALYVSADNVVYLFIKTLFTYSYSSVHNE